MAVAKKRIPAKPGKKSPAARKAARPAAKKKTGLKGTARPAAKVVSRSAQPKPARKKIAAKKAAAPKKAVTAEKGKKPGAQKKIPGKKILTPRTAAGKTARALPAAARKKSVAPKKTAGKKTVKKVSARKRPARAKESAAGLTPVTDRIRGLKGMLIAKREGILKEAKDEIAKYMSGDNRQLVDTAIDEGDWAVVDISEDLSLRRLAAHRQLLLDIDECLRKIQEGTYGICEECGEEISQKRLNVIPTASLCIDCKENKEKMEKMEQVTAI